MAELARTTGGSASAAANTAAGKMERMQLAMRETKESIGGALLPAMSALASVLLTVSEWAQQNSTVFVILLGTIGALSAVVLAYSAASAVASAATGIWAAAEGAWTAVMGLKTSTLGTAIGLAYLSGVVLGRFHCCDHREHRGDRSVRRGYRGRVRSDNRLDRSAVATQRPRSSRPRSAGSCSGSQPSSPLSSCWSWATKTTWFQTIWNAAWGCRIKAAASAVFNWIRGNWPLLIGILAGAHRGGAVALVVTHFSQITNAARQVWSDLSGAFTAVWGAISGAATSALGMILGPIHAIESALHSVIGAIQDVIGWLSKIKVPSIGGALKALNPFGHAATAGYTPTYLIPAGQSTVGRSAGPTSGRGGANVTITVNVPATANPTETGRAVAGALRSYFAAGGRLTVPS